MDKIGEVLTWMIISLLIIWLVAMAVASSPCVLVHRSVWPWTYTMSLIETVSQNWTSDETKLKMIVFKAKGAVGIERFTEKTVYGDTQKCSK